MDHTKMREEFGLPCMRPYGTFLRGDAFTQASKEFPRIAAATGGMVLHPQGEVHPRAMTVAVIFSGGPAGGGHNVLAGIHDMITPHGGKVYGVHGGPAGLIKGDIVSLNSETIDRARDQGGFWLLGTSRTKITQADIPAVRRTCKEHKIDAIVIVGGDDSNTNAVFLAEALFDQLQVIGVPKTMDGDLQQGDLLPISFGFDTACTVYADLVSNLMVDARSALKYWHIVKLMGRSASHVTLEVALRTEPHLALISEEMENRSLHDVIEEIADLVIERAKRGTPYGVIVVPEGLLEFLPDLRGLFTELARAVPTGEASKSAVASDAALGMLSPQARSLFTSLPDYVQRTLLASRDEHGNLTVSQLETDRFLADLVEARLKEKSPTTPFSPITHFYGYEGRCGPPSLFDLRLGYFLGLNAGAVALNGATGYLASYTGLGPFSPVALPLIGMLHQELRHGERTFVIKKSLVDTSSPAFRAFTERRGAWRTQPSSPVVLPVQYSGDLSERVPMSVALNRG